MVRIRVVGEITAITSIVAFYISGLRIRTQPVHTWIANKPSAAAAIAIRAVGARDVKTACDWVLVEWSAVVLF